MKKKPNIFYAMASAGMGHATRAIPMLERLEKNYDIHIFCNGKANRWLSQSYKYVHNIHTIKPVVSKNKISIKLVEFKAYLQLPITIFYVLKIFFMILIKKPKAVITDFEIHSSYAARLANFFYPVPIISCDHWTTLVHSQCPFSFTKEEEIEFRRWSKNIDIITKQADYFLVHKTLETKLNTPKAQYVPVPVRDSFIEAGKNITYDGPIVVAMSNAYQNNEIVNLLKMSSHRFIIFGNFENHTDGNIEYRSFDEEKYIQSIQNAKFTIVNANSSAIDILAVNKAMIFVPNPGQFEQLYCGKMFEHLGVASLQENLTLESIDTFSNNLETYNNNIKELNLFDNEKLFEIIISYIKK